MSVTVTVSAERWAAERLSESVDYYYEAMVWKTPWNPGGRAGFVQVPCGPWHTPSGMQGKKYKKWYLEKKNIGFTVFKLSPFKFVAWLGRRKRVVKTMTVLWGPNQPRRSQMSKFITSWLAFCFAQKKKSQHLMCTIYRYLSESVGLGRETRMWLLSVTSKAALQNKMWYDYFIKTSYRTSFESGNHITLHWRRKSWNNLYICVLDDMNVMIE